MALIDCIECGNKVSDKAEICPSCGIKVAKYVVTNPAKKGTQISLKTGCLIIVIVFLVTPIIFSIFANINSPSNTNMYSGKSDAEILDEIRARRAAEEKRWNSLTPKQKAAETAENKKKSEAEAKKAETEKAKQAKEAQLIKYRVKTELLVEQVKANTRNPDSFQVINALYTEDGASCIKYRGQNGFGGFSVEQVSMVNDVIKMNDTKHWNRYCANKTGYSIY